MVVDTEGLQLTNSLFFSTLQGWYATGLHIFVACFTIKHLNVGFKKLLKILWQEIWELSTFIFLFV